MNKGRVGLNVGGKRTREKRNACKNFLNNQNFACFDQIQILLIVKYRFRQYSSLKQGEGTIVDKTEGRQLNEG